SRRLFGTVGVAPDIEFVATDLDPLASLQSAVATNSYLNHGSLALLFEDLLGDVRFRSPWRDLDNSIAHVAAEVRAHLPAGRQQRDVERVEVCFTLPSFDVVFKVIRDRFPYPKTVLREEVLAKYQMVFIHDRAGRLVDAQEFRRLRFPRERFAPELLDELRREAAHTVHEDGADLVFDHMYIERRMTPLNLFLRSTPAADAERVVL